MFSFDFFLNRDAHFKNYQIKIQKMVNKYRIIDIVEIGDYGFRIYSSNKDILNNIIQDLNLNKDKNVECISKIKN